LWSGPVFGFEPYLTFWTADGQFAGQSQTISDWISQCFATPAGIWTLHPDLSMWFHPWPTNLVPQPPDTHIQDAIDPDLSMPADAFAAPVESGLFVWRPNGETFLWTDAFETIQGQGMPEFRMGNGKSVNLRLLPTT
jgi:hypothetical protein